MDMDMEKKQDIISCIQVIQTDYKMGTIVVTMDENFHL